MTEKTCPTCGAVVPPRAGTHGGPQRRYCSYKCQDGRPRAPKPYRHQATCAQCGIPFMARNQTYRHCPLHTRKRGGVSRPAVTCALPACDVEFVPRHGRQRCCSDPHGKQLWRLADAARAQKRPSSQWNDKRRDSAQRRRARKKAAATGRPVLLADIRARDKNRCHLCGDRVPAKTWPHPLSPSLDHVIPLSKGGIHDPDNVKLAHLQCNVQKGAGGGNEQLLLIG